MTDNPFDMPEYLYQIDRLANRIKWGIITGLGLFFVWVLWTK